MATQKNILVEKSLQFALDVIEYSELLEYHRKFVIAKQLLRSGTSVGANVCEAQHAESLVDFIHKLKIAAKEAEETEYWLTLCQMSKNYPNIGGLSDNIKEIQKILTKIIYSSKQKLNKIEAENL